MLGVTGTFPLNLVNTKRYINVGTNRKMSLEKGLPEINFLQKSLKKKTRLRKANPRALGTNPRALGTNPRALKNSLRALESNER